MKKILLTLAVTLMGSLAMAEYHYDYKTGNSYTTMGNTTFGNNANTGSTWSSTTNGSNTYGTDSNGNSWNYNSQTGAYHNSNGTSCYGHGYSRVCN